MPAGIIGDLEAGAIVLPSVYGSTTGINATAAGTTVDMIDALGNYSTAILVVGVVTGTSPTLDVKIQESTDGSTWTDATDPSGNTVAFTQVTTSTNVQVVGWQPRKRYCRSTATTGGTSPVFPATVTIIGQRRSTPSNAGGFSQASSAS
jgi:hypothetical protein